MRGERKREETETERRNVCRRPWRPETASDPLELELQAQIESYLTGVPGTGLWKSRKHS